MTFEGTVIEIAKNELGYYEKKTNSNLDSKTENAGNGNYTKYARDAYERGLYNGNKNGYDWCAVFVDWVLYTACLGLKADFTKVACVSTKYGAGVYWNRKHYADKGRTGNTPKVGCLVVFNNNKHIGIVEDIKDGYIHTIEGNTYGDNDNSGIGCVGRHKYAIGSDVITCYCYPDYSISEEDSGVDDYISEWHKDGVNFCVSNGIFIGDGNGNYHWKDSITREECATVVQRLYNMIMEIELK